MTVKKFEEALVSEGIEEIKVNKNEDFNPDVHEAIAVMENGGNKGKIMEVVSPGWRFTGGPVIKHAQVKVAKG